MIRLLLLALPISLLGWWGLRRLGLDRARAWQGGVALSAAALGLAVILGDVDRPEGQVLAVALWFGVHAVLYLLLRPLIGRAR